MKSDEEVKAAEVLRAETLKADDLKDLDQILGDDKSKEEKKGNITKDEMMTGMDDIKRRALEEVDEEEEKKENRKESSKDERDDFGDKSDIGRKKDDNPEDYYGDDVNNEIDSADFIRSLGTQAYIDFPEF